MFKYILLILLLFTSLAHANTEISTAGTNLGIGTTDTNNNLSLTTGLAIGNSTYTETTAPSTGAIIQGNVGIGSVNPGTILDVHGTIRSTGLTVNTNGISNSAGYTQSGTTTNYFPGTTEFAGGNATIANTSGDFYTDGSGQFGGGTSCSSEFCVYNGNMTIGATTGSAPSEGLFVTGNVGVGTYQGNFGLSVMNGNVGIGTNNPTFNLQVNGAIGIGTTAGNGALEVFGGNVGIENSNPLNTLDVSGNIGIGQNDQINTDGLGLLLGEYGDPTSIYMGDGAGAGISTGQNYYNVIIGQSALYGESTNDGYNVAIGPATLADSTSTYDNIALGYASLQSASSAYKNVAIGPYSLTNLGTSYFNVGEGFYTLEQLISGNNNIAIGVNAGYQANPGSGINFTTGSNNILIGYDAGVLGNGDNNEIAIGYGAIGSGLNTTTLGDSSTVATVIPDGGLVIGNIGVGTVVPNGSLIVVSGNVGIGSVNPKGNLDMGTGSICLTGTCNATWPSGGGSNYWTTSTGGNIGIGTFNGVGVGTLSGNDILTVLGNVGINTVNANSAFEVENGNVSIGTASVPAGGSKNLVVWGNVGIGTTNIGGTGEGGLSVMDGNVGIGTWVPNAGLAVKYNGSGNIQNWLNSSGSQLLAVDSSGNLTTTSSQQPIKIYGFTANGNYWSAFGEAAQSNTILGISTNASTNYGLVINGVTSQSADLQRWENSAGTVLVNVTASGNVGINTSLPSSILSVDGGVGIGTTATSSFLGTAAPAGGLIVQNNVGIGTTLTTAAGLSVMNGNVGIGTWAPGGQLAFGAANSVITGNTGLTIGESGDTYGPTTLILENRNNANGPIFSTLGSSQALVDFGFIPGSGSQQNIRLETRSGDTDGTGNSAGEFQIGPAGNPNFIIGAGTIASVSSNVGIQTEAPVNALGVNGQVGIGFSYSKNYTAPTNGMIVQGDVGIGTYVPGATLSFGGTCQSSAIGQDVCWGTSTSGAACIGYCTAGTFPACSTCTCC